MINDKLKSVLILVIFSCILLGALSCISATSNNNISPIGTNINSNNTTNNSINIDNNSTAHTLTSEIKNNETTDNNDNNDFLNIYNSNEANKFESENQISIITNNVTADYGTNNSFTVNLTDQNGNPLSNQVILINLTNTNGQYKNYSITTNNNGSASLSLSLNTGNYTITSNYNGNTVINSITINKINTHINGEDINTIYGNIKNYTLYLTDIQGLPLADQIVGINIKSKDGSDKTYILTSDNNGTVTINTEEFTSGYYTLTAIYNGTENYNQTTTINTLTINPTTLKASAETSSNYTQLITNDFTETYGQGLNFTVRLIDIDGNPIIGQHIALNLTKISNSASKIYWTTTDTEGYAYLQINLAPGNYSTKSSYSGSKTYSASEDEFNSMIVYWPGTNNSTSNTSKTNTTTKEGYISISNIVIEATEVMAYVEDYGRLPNYVTIDGIQYTQAQFAYLLTTAINKINSGSSSDIQIINVTKKTATDLSISGNLTASAVISMASRIATYINSYGNTPKYDSSNDLGKISFNNYVYVFCELLSYYDDKNSFPTTVNVDSSVFGISSGNSTTNNTNITTNITTKTTGSGINDVNTINNTSVYLVATANCEVNNAQIQALAASLISGLNTTLEQATAIYDFVRDNISYSYYANTKYGALGTLTKGYGNCVDQASLVIALFRAAGIPARYVHGKGCTFTSGLYTGHVWAQVLVDGVWYCADCTSTRNSLGHIVNWNTASFTLASISAEISF